MSGIDRSVQYFGVVPMAAGDPARSVQTPGAKPALVLTLHGAGVEGIGQARAYKPKDWAVIVAATNRRPYGFDWEDWGRLDALEVLGEARRLFGTDPARTYLTGHSMGGHGTWQIGATVPGPWAAIAPSAGWHSFSSYGGGAAFKDPSPVEKMLLRANDPERDDRPVPEFPQLRRLHPSRRPGRQRPGDPGAVHARAPGQVPSRFRVL